MKEKLIKTNKLEKNMKKILLFVLLISLISLKPVQANFLFGLPPVINLTVSLPESKLNVIGLHTIESAGYGFGNDSTPIVYNFQTPYYQSYDKTYFKLGYIPICDVNQTNAYLSLYCGDDYLYTWNITDNCPAANYQWAWVTLDLTNSTQFQTLTSSSVVNCRFYVNDTSVDNRTDVWIRMENLGTKIEIVQKNREIFPELEAVQEAISNLITFINAIVVLGIGIFSGLAPIWIMFAMILFAVFLFIQLRRKAKQLARGK